MAPEDALRDAHLPALVAALYHLTGDRDLLGPEYRAAYPEDMPTMEQLATGGYPEALQEAIRARAAAVLADPPTPIEPDAAAVERLIDNVAGADVPERYRAFLMDEVGIGGVDTKTPRWSDAERAAAGGMHVVIVGAGMSGLLAGIRLKQAGVAFTILDKNADVGGTWFENTYPGCRVDNPNHMYSYSFEPTHDFPQHFSAQPVLLDYFRGVAERHGLREHIRFGTEVKAADWDDAAARWRVTTAAGETIEATALVMAVGQLNRPRLPDIPGREDFAGPAFHSARWEHDVELAGKRVAVIGTGASAYQFVPRIADAAAHLDVFQRTPPWSIPRPHYHDDVSAGKQWLLEHVPFYARWYRFFLFWTLTDGLYDMVKRDPEWQDGPAVSAANAELHAMLAGAIEAQVADRPDLAPHLVPAYPFGGKRAVLDNGDWIATLKRDDVSLVTDRIERIEADAVVTADGTRRAADVLIYGTGFEASRFLWPMAITGRGGRRLEDEWAGDARAYLGVIAPGFPNLFMLYGPNTNIVVNGSIVFFSECAVRYVVGCLELLAARSAATIEVRRDVHDAFNARVDAANEQMAWGAPAVTSWYKNAKGRVSQNWPFPIVDYWLETLEPDPDDFLIDGEPATPARVAA